MGLEEKKEPEELEQPASKVSFEACINLQNLYKEYKDRYKQFFESLVQKNDEELKMLTFRLDFNEYYTDKFYQASDFDFKSQSIPEDYKASSISMNADQPIIVEEEKSKKGVMPRGKAEERKTEEKRTATKKSGLSSTKIMPGKESGDGKFRKFDLNKTDKKE